jgi:hypothetical protein
MRRFGVFRSGAVVLLLGVLLALGGATTAQEATPTAMSGHPLVGTWLLDTDAEDPANAPEVTTFTTDGAYISVDAEGFVQLGLWEATGEQTATLTLVSSFEEDGAFAGTFMIRAAIDVEPGGDAFTAEYTGELVDPTGAGGGEYGPGTATAARIAVEAMGTPVGPLSVLFGEEEEGATPTP